MVDCRGSFGVVRRVEHIRTHEVFAAKIQKAKLGSKSDQDNEREGRILRTVRHVSLLLSCANGSQTLSRSRIALRNSL
jgi:serine/threonine protein kinase